MFAEFLIGIVLLSSLILLVLLVQPKPNDDIRTDRLPFIGTGMILLVAVLVWMATTLA